MNYAEVNLVLAWVAVQGLQPDQALAALEMEYSEDADVRDVADWPNFSERADFRERVFVGLLPGDWLLLFGDIDEDEKECLAALAKFGPTFLGQQFSTGCFSEARWYADGQQAWRLDYDSECRSPYDRLKIDGQLPDNLVQIVGQAYTAAAQGIVPKLSLDIVWEVPGKLSKAVCGFDPQEGPPDGFRWSMVQPIGGVPAPEPEQRGWLSRLFGRR
ncbi:hypothetical protein [Sphingomonas sp.]|uniref:hypothetical protein n=1 Tax=Sphingomonas sp. TaxID=28214 RepID=UPI003B3B6BE0